MVKVVRSVQGRLLDQAGRMMIVIFLLTAMGEGLTALAQVVRMGDKEYIQRVWRSEDGLPQNTVTSIVQTRDGYIWVGTFGGLARFDGVRFTLFTSSNTPGLKGNRIVWLFEDREGALWIISQYGTLTRYADGRFSDYTDREGMPAGDIHCVLPDSQGNLWVGTHLQGALQFHSGRLIKRYTTLDGLPTNFVNAITEDRAGNLWVCAQGGLVKINHITGAAQNMLPADSISNLIESRDGSLLVICRGSVTVGGKTFANGTFWIGTYGGGLNRFKDGRFVHITAKDGLFEDIVSRIRKSMTCAGCSMNAPGFMICSARARRCRSSSTRFATPRGWIQPCSSKERPERARSWSPALFTIIVRAKTSLSSPSIARG